MAERKIRIGHVGTKHDHSEGKLACLKKFPDLFEIVGIVEHDEDRLPILKEKHIYDGIPRLTDEQLLNAGIDAVIVEGYEKDLPFEALPYAENGIHIHLDKPAGEDLDAFRTLLRTVKKNKTALQMAYMYRYNPAFMDCNQLIKEGRLGDILSVTAVMNTRHEPEKRRWLEQFCGGDMFFLGCHMVDFIYHLQGVPERVIPFLKRTGLDGTNAVDHATVLFEYERGTSIAQATSVEVNGYGRRQLVVCGSEGSYEIKPLECPTHAYLTEYKNAKDKTYAYAAKERELYSLAGDERYDGMMLDFARMVRGEIENPYSFDYELELQKLVLASCGIETDYRRIEHI